MANIIFSLSELQTTCNLWTTVQTNYKQKSTLGGKGILKHTTMYKIYNIKNDLKNEIKIKMKWNDSKCTLRTERGLVIANIIIIIIQILEELIIILWEGT
jgi:hypothetical protein